MNQPLRPENIGPPSANYELGMRVPAGSELVYTAGIGGIRPDGTISDNLDEQAEQCWQNIAALLAEGGMGVGDIVTYTTYVVNGEDLSVVMAARDSFFGEHLAASVLIPVPELVDPTWKLEISVVAAKVAS